MEGSGDQLHLHAYAFQYLLELINADEYTVIIMQSHPTSQNMTWKHAPFVVTTVETKLANHCMDCELSFSKQLSACEDPRNVTIHQSEGKFLCWHHLTLSTHFNFLHDDLSWYKKKSLAWFKTTGWFLQDLSENYGFCALFVTITWISSFCFVITSLVTRNMSTCQRSYFLD